MSIMNFFFLILRLFIFAAKINFWEWLGSWWETGTILCSNESWKMIWWSVWRIFLFGSMNPDPLREIRPKTVPSIIGQKTINSTGWRLLILLVSHFKRVGVNCSNCNCSTRNCSTLFAGKQLLDTNFINCSNPVNPG